MTRYPAGWPPAKYAALKSRVFYGYCFVMITASFTAMLTNLWRPAVVLTVQFVITLIVYGTVRRTAWDRFMDDP